MALETAREVRKMSGMGMFDPKKRKIFTALIVAILVLAMVVPTLLSMIVW